MTLLALVADTFRESLARKVFLGFWACSTILLALLVTMLNIDLVEGGLASIRLFGQDVDRGAQLPVENIVDLVLGGIAALLFSAGLFLAIFAAAGLIPTIFEPGRIELLLSKPLSRTRILLGKYLGALTVVALNIACLVGGAWLILGFKTGIWKAAFLYSGVLSIFTFAVLLSIVTFFAVASRSSVLSSMAAYVVTLVAVIAAQYEQMSPLFNSETPRQALRLTYWVLPKIFELGNWSRTLMEGKPIESFMPLWSSALFAGATLFLAARLFESKDY